MKARRVVTATTDAYRVVKAELLDGEFFHHPAAAIFAELGNAKRFACALARERSGGKKTIILIFRAAEQVARYDVKS